MDIQEIININPEILGDTPVFMGTRVPIQSLIWHLEKGISIDAFLDDFPTVRKEQAIALLEIANRLVGAENIAELYASAA